MSKPPRYMIGPWYWNILRTTTPSEQKVFDLVWMITQTKQDQCRAGNEHLGGMCGMSGKTVGRAINALVLKGYLGQCSKRYKKPGGWMKSRMLWIRWSQLDK